MNRAALAAVAFLVALGTAWSFQRGAPDFNVFYVAWEWVWRGDGMQIYRHSPDRYLYAPGFAWLLSPLAALPRDLALAVWCFAKAAALAIAVRATAQRLAQTGVSTGPAQAWLAASLGVLMFARPLLIDFQYGQVNLLIAAVALVSLLVMTDPDPRPRASAACATLMTFAAVTKLIILPILLVPYAIGRASRNARTFALVIPLALAVIALLPGCSLDFASSVSLYREWLGALNAKGFPLESHNQSFAAVLHHLLSGEPTRIIGLYGERLVSVGRVASPDQLRSIAAAWSFGSFGLMIAWLMRGPRVGARVQWAALSVALMILPSHLVWKPYFVFSIGIAGVWLAETIRRPTSPKWAVTVLLFLSINLSSGSFLGAELAGRLEAMGMLFWTNLALVIATLALRPPSILPARAEL